MRKNDILARIDAVIAKGQATIDSVPLSAGGMLANLHTTRIDPDHCWVDPGIAANFRSAGLSLLRSLYGPDHHHFRDFDETTNDKRVLSAYRTAHGLLLAVREEIDLGWYTDTRALIAADVFGDILEMAEYLLSEGYKDAAAVLIGGTLEGHLRGLAQRNRIQVVAERDGRLRPRKSESLNQELMKAGVYGLGDQKQVTAWLNLRNDAAHGHYDKYTQEQVDLMRQGVADLMIRVPG